MLLTWPYFGPQLLSFLGVGTVLIAVFVFRPFLFWMVRFSFWFLGEGGGLMPGRVCMGFVPGVAPGPGSRSLFEGGRHVVGLVELAGCRECQVRCEALCRV